ncbi:hypothetical protein TWF694_002124 [Orbilia ellipsospora]|uniref:Zn(2)-C6 fungal-type domain-containing protein n=1 Tax=Orbilia ellipsospora TaxID=2528407 RepID=A0AAV9X775_9PEZI
MRFERIIESESSLVPEASVSPTDRASPDDASTSAATPSKQPAFNCLVCKNRKVKCDRQVPCSTCVKLGVDCQYVEPGPRKKRKSSSKHENILQRLNKYEELLKHVESNMKLLDGVEGSRAASTSEDTTSEKSPERSSKKVKLDRPYPEHELSTTKKGGILSITGRSRYFENNLWNSLNEELQELKETILDSCDEEKQDELNFQNYVQGPFISTGLFGSNPCQVDLSPFHPSPAHCVILWNYFLENVNPLTLIIHHPSLQEKVMVYKDKPQTMPRNMEALMFAIYSVTVLSLDNRQCQALFGELRDDLLAKYRYCSQAALKKAGTLKTTDIVVLQALVFHLLDLRSYYDYPSLWVITGMAVRIAQRMGVHRDGSKLQLPPFETEMRRRLWREILILDFRTAELSGAGLYTMAIDENAWDSRWPTSINETDIWPGMTEVPKEREGPTENMWCQLRGELGNLFVERWRRIHRLNFTASTVKMYENSPVPIGHNGDTLTDFTNYYRAVDTDEELEKIAKTLEEKYIRHCDPVNPLHLFTSIVCRSALANIRLMTHHPIRRPDGGASMSQEERDTLFANSIKILEYDNLCHSTRSIQKFLWHVKSFFQWHAFIYLVGELRTRAEGPDVEKAWACVDEVFEHHQEWLGRREDLHSAIIAVALKAWEFREVLLQKLGKLEKVVPPVFVQTLRAMYQSSSGITAPASATKVNSAAAASSGDGLPNNFSRQPNFHFITKQAMETGGQIPGLVPSSGGSTSTAPTPITGSGGASNPGLDTTAPTTNMTTPTNIHESSAASMSSNGLSNSSAETPINWSEWESLLQNSELLGFTSAFKVPAYGGFYNWNA